MRALDWGSPCPISAMCFGFGYITGCYHYLHTVKARLHYETELNSTVVADKKQGPTTIQSLSSGLEYTKTAVLNPATL